MTLPSKAGCPFKILVMIRGYKSLEKKALHIKFQEAVAGTYNKLFKRKPNMSRSKQTIGSMKATILCYNLRILKMEKQC